MAPPRPKGSGTRFWTTAVALLLAGIVAVLWRKNPRPRPALPAAPPSLHPPRAPIARPTAPPPVRDPSWPDPAVLRARMQEELAFGGPLTFAESAAHLPLTFTEHNLLLYAIIDFQHVAAQLEQPLLTVKSFDGASLVLFLPAYPEEGAALKAALIQRIDHDFPPDRAAVILAAMDRGLDESFGDFGRFSRTMRISAPGEDRSTIKIVFSAELPDGQKAPDPKTPLARYRGSASMGRDGLPLYYEGLADTIQAYFPLDPALAPPARP